jgi:uncharacterized Fe-S cluster-containing radical SAM superfamily protein
VAGKLEKIARDKGFHNLRVSGAEPTMGRGHLIELINTEDKQFLFILETNGVPQGHGEENAEEFTGENVHVRVALKGASREEFAILTNAKPEFYDYQLHAHEYLDIALARELEIVDMFTCLISKGRRRKGMC